MTDIEFIDVQHRVIVNMSCACSMRWIKDGAEREIVKQCGRCRVIAEYEARIVKTQENA